MLRLKIRFSMWRRREKSASSRSSLKLWRKVHMRTPRRNIVLANFRCTQTRCQNAILLIKCHWAFRAPLECVFHRSGKIFSNSFAIHIHTHANRQKYNETYVYIYKTMRLICNIQFHFFPLRSLCIFRALALAIVQSKHIIFRVLVHVKLHLFSPLHIHKQQTQLTQTKKKHIYNLWFGWIWTLSSLQFIKIDKMKRQKRKKTVHNVSYV